MKKKKKNKIVDSKRVRHELEVKIYNGVLQCRICIVEKRKLFSEYREKGRKIKMTREWIEIGEH